MENDQENIPEYSVENDSKIAQGEAQTSLIKKNPLRHKQKIFIQFYTEIGAEHYGNGTQCAIKAGYSKRSASAIATELLARPSIKAAIELANEERAKSFDWDFERWTRELIAIFDALTPTNPQKLKAIELIGKSKGFIKDNQIQLNTINIIGDQDIAKIRGIIAEKMTKRLTTQYADSPIAVSTNPMQINNNSTASGGA